MNQSEDQTKTVARLVPALLTEAYRVGELVNEHDGRITSLISQQGDMSNQMEFVLDWIRENDAKKYGVGSSTFTHSFVTSYPIRSTSVTTPFVWTQPLFALPSSAKSDSRQEPSVPLHTVLETGAIVAGFLCCASLATWALNSVPILNPLAAIMGLIASPFFYAMGRRSRAR